MKVVATQNEYNQSVRPIDGPSFAGYLQFLMNEAYRPQATYSQLNLLGSHDTARFLTLVRRDKAALRMAVTTTMTLPGTPCIYYGDEVGMEGRHHPEVRNGVHDENGWGFLGRVEHQLRTYDPEVVAAQLNLLGSHDMARIRTICGGDTAAVQLATLAQMTLPGAPCIYYGDEVGMEGRHDPDCRRAFPWDESAWDKDLLAYVKAATTLRHAQPALRHGLFTVVAAQGDAMGWSRTLEGEQTVVTLLNAGKDPAALSFEIPAGTAGLVPAAPVLAGSATARVDRIASTATVELAPRSAAVFVVS
jgi:glycosidase